MRRNAFTLIEVLVVVAIIALLVAILLPSLHGARAQAKSTLCATHLHQIAVGIWNYWTDNDGRVPYVFTPFTNGTGRQDVPAFGNSKTADGDIDPFHRTKWPNSLENDLAPRYLGDARGVFACPAAIVGWPRSGGPFQATYRPAAINQPNGMITDPASYDRRAFGFLDGRRLQRFVPRPTGNIILDAQNTSARRGTYLRDFVKRDGDRVIGPHRGGINVIDRNLDVQFRNKNVIQDDLALNGGGVRF